MPIKSYLAYPNKGQKDALIEALSHFSECEIVPAENQDLVVVVSDTISNEQEQQVEERLKQLKALAHLGLVSVYRPTG